MSDTFVPPKPNEFDNERLTFSFILSCGTKFIPEQLSEILSRFSVGGISLFLSDKIENIASIEPDAPRRCPVDDFVDDMKRLVLSENNFFTAANSISSPKGVDVP